MLCPLPHDNFIIYENSAGTVTGNSAGTGLGPGSVSLAEARIAAGLMVGAGAVAAAGLMVGAATE